MGCRVEQILLVECFFLLICIAEGWSTKELSVCPGETASFSYKYNPEGYRRLKYIFTDKDGQPLEMWKIKFDEQKPTLHEDYEERFTITSVPVVGFSLQNVSSADIGNYGCFILYPNGTSLFLKWNLHVKDSTELRKPKIDSKNESECVIYTCSHNETVEVDTYWKWNRVERLNGSSLTICGKNPSKVECIIKTSCNNNSVTEEIEGDLPASKCITDLGTVVYALAACLAVSLLILLAFVVVFLYLESKRRHQKRGKTKEDAPLTRVLTTSN